MLLLFFVLFSWNSLQADVVSSSKKVHNTRNIVLTTPPGNNNNKGRNNLFFDVTPPIIDRNITSYDWSISTEQLFENQQYNYKDVWWVTIRDYYKVFDSDTKKSVTEDSQKILENTTGIETEGITETTAVSNNDVQKIPDNTTEIETEATTETAGITNNDVTSTTITDINNENNNSEVRMSNVKFRPKNAIKDRNFYSNIFKKDFPKNLNLDSDLGDTNVRANAIKRNKQIQRMLDEIAPQVDKTNVTAKTIVNNSNKLGVNVEKFGRNQSLNLLYNKLVESLQLNVDANKMNELGSLKLEDIKKYYRLDETQPTEKTILVSAGDVSTPVNRQGTSPETTPPHSSLESPDPPWMEDNWWGTSERPVELVKDLKRQMGQYRTGYFTMFLAQAAHSISEMPPSEVRLIGLSLERECFNLIHQDKHILSFGQPSLTALEQFATNFSILPPEYVQVTRHQPPSKYLSTPQKQHKKDGFKQKHPKIYNKYIQLKRKVHKKHSKREKLKEFESRYYGTQKLFDKLNGYEKFSKNKAEKLKQKRLHNLSETDFEEVYSSYGTESLNSYESYTDYDTDENDLKLDSSLIAASKKDKKSTSRATSRTRAKNLTTSYKASRKTARTFKIHIPTKTTERNEMNIFNFYELTNQAVKLNLRHAIDRKTVKAVSNIKATKTVSKYKNGASNRNKAISKTNVQHNLVKNGITPKETAKNKLTDLTSYSDEEDTLKFQLSDAMRHDKKYFNPIRRSNIRKRFKKGINEFSSYSSEEIVLKSNIYKALGFQNFSAPNEVVKRANHDVNVKKLRFEKFRPINQMSSYSDEEDILKEKIKLQN